MIHQRDAFMSRCGAVDGLPGAQVRRLCFARRRVGEVVQAWAAQRAPRPYAPRPSAYERRRRFLSRTVVIVIWLRRLRTVFTTPPAAASRPVLSSQATLNSSNAASTNLIS